MMRIEIEGGGTIATATAWSSTLRLSAAGNFTFSMPATDPAAALVVPLAVVRCYQDNVLVGAGLVDEIANDGSVITVSGDDLARELAETTVRAMLENTAQAIITQLGTYLPAGWTLVNQVADNTTVLIARCYRDSLLAFLSTICELGGLYYWVDERTLTVSDGPGAVQRGVVPISLRRNTSSYDVLNRVYPFGAGDGKAALTIYAANVSLPAGYVIDGANNSITYTPSPYPRRERRIDFKQIAPQANTDAGIVTAANALAIAGYNALKAAITPVVTYDAALAWGGRLLPLQRLALVYDGDGLAINETLVITDVTVQARPGGMMTTAVTLEANARRALSDAEIVAGAIKAARLGPVYPQLIASQDTLVLTADTDMQTGLVQGQPTLGFRFSDLTTQVLGVYLELSMEARPLAQYGRVRARLPSAIGYRFNNSGGYTTYPGGRVFPGTNFLQIGPTSGFEIYYNISHDRRAFRVCHALRRASGENPECDPRRTVS
jgi:hypothetical protein